MSTLINEMNKAVDKPDCCCDGCKTEPESRRELYSEFEDAIELAATKVAPLFNLFGWTWDKVPTANQIENSITELLDHMGKDSTSVGSGRLTVRRDENEDGNYDYDITLDLSHIFDVPKSYRHGE